MSETSDLIPLETAGTLDGLFLQRLKRTPDSTAYRYYNESENRWQDFTWAETAAQAARWQTALKTEPLNPGDRVAIMARNSPSWIMFDQAALGSGLIVIPLYKEDRAGNIAHIIQDAGVKLLVLDDLDQWKQLEPVHDRLDDLIRVVIIRPFERQETQTRLIRLEEWLPAQGAALADRRGNPDDLATIVYTSGTTGKPKGVMLSHHNILWNCSSGVQSVAVYSEDIFLSFLPLSHMFERSIGYYLPVMTGSVVAFSRSIPQLAEDLTTVCPTILISVPRIFERVYNKIQAQLDDKPLIARKLFDLTLRVGALRFDYAQGRAPWHPALLLWPLLDRIVAAKVKARLGGRLRFSISGGAALSPRVSRMFLSLGVSILQGYGMTETAPVLSVNKLDDNDPSSVGLLLNDVQAQVGEQDELLVKSPGVMLGYWNNSEATNRLIDSEGWLHTGDRAKLEKRRIHITGRIKEIIVMANGEKVPPVDIETAIAMDPLFEQVMVIGEGRPFLGALVVLSEESKSKEHNFQSVNSKELKKLLIARIARKMADFPGYARIHGLEIPDAPFTVENGLLTPTLKLRRSRIAERYKDLINRIYGEQ